MKTNGSFPAQPNQSLIKGILCLQTMVIKGRPMGIRELSRKLHYDHTCVSRLLGTLASIGLAEKNAECKYQAGAGIHVLAAQSLQSSRLLACALPHIRNLLDEHLIVSLGVLWRKQVCYLFHGRNQDSLEEGIGATRPYPAFKSSIGVAILASLGQNAARRMMLQGPDRLCKKDMQLLNKLISDARKKGYSMLSLTPPWATIAVAIGHPAIVGLAFSGINLAKIKDKNVYLQRLAKRLSTAAEQIETGLVSQNKGGIKK
ncbi:helix-turn-helix domain-containing protein [Verrucomicrobiota bacterium]